MSGKMWMVIICCIPLLAFGLYKFVTKLPPTVHKLLTLITVCVLILFGLNYLKFKLNQKGCWNG